MRKQACGNCEYWVPVDSLVGTDELGGCHYNPPAMVGNSGRKYEWPIVKKLDTACSKFEPPRE
jgi:hypothetical protein